MKQFLTNYISKVQLRISFKKYLKKHLWKVAFIATLAIVSSFMIISCGQNKNARLGGPYGPGGYTGFHGGGTYLDEAIGYNALEGHSIHLIFLSHGYVGGGYTGGYTGGGYLGHHIPNRRNGPVNIQGSVTFGGNINSNYFGGFGQHRPPHNLGGRFGHVGHHPYNPYGYGYDPCYIPTGMPLQLTLSPEFGPAIRQGNDFGEYELLAHGLQGEIIALSPVNPNVGASFVGGHNSPNGELYVHMEVIVTRIDSGAYCPENFITFGARF